jgi:hypothetical protein
MPGLPMPAARSTLRERSVLRYLQKPAYSIRFTLERIFSSAFSCFEKSFFTTQ